MMPDSAMPVTRTVTVNGLLDEAIAQMPWFRRRAWQARLSMPRARNKVCCELIEQIHDDPRAAAMGLQPVFGSSSFTEDTPFSIDVDRIREILDLFLEYLPQIIKLFQMLFASILLLVVFGMPQGQAVAEVTLNPLAYAEIHAESPAARVSVITTSLAEYESPALANGEHQVAGEWTFPGGVSDHLMGGNHRFSAEQLAGKSQAELERMHSIDHATYGAVPARARGRSTASAMSGCPTGGCPTSASSRPSQRQGLVRRILGR